MEQSEYAVMAAVEDRHWWYGGMRAITAALLDQVYHGRSDLSILDAGCGTGGNALFLRRYGTVVGIDLAAAATELGGQRLPGVLARGSVLALPFADASFDLVCQMTVLSTILDAELRRRVAAEMRRVVRPDGLIISYDLRRGSPGNRGVRPLARAELTALFPACRLHIQSLTLAPPLARLVVPRSWLLAELLSRLPPLRTHLLAAIRPWP